LSSTLRIRDKEATIRQLDLPKGTLDKLQQLVSSNVAEDVKKFAIKKLTGGNPCCVCGGIPFYQVLYDVENATRIERYCQNCIKKLYAREQAL
jgi:hypothetical protein